MRYSFEIEGEIEANDLDDAFDWLNDLFESCEAPTEWTIKEVTKI